MHGEYLKSAKDMCLFNNLSGSGKLKFLMKTLEYVSFSVDGCQLTFLPVLDAEEFHCPSSMQSTDLIQRVVKTLDFYIKVLYTISHTLSSSALVFTMNALKKMMAISLTLWLILITPALVGGSRIHSSSKEAALVGGSGVYGSSKEAVVMQRGPVPSSSSSPCTHIGIGNGNDRPCPPSTHP